MNDALSIAGARFQSRLFLGSGRYDGMKSFRRSLEASRTEMVTVAVRRLPIDPKTGKIDDAANPLLHVPKEVRILPNTAGCATAAEAVRVALLAREMGLSEWVKLEVIPDPEYLLPDPIGTLEAARELVRRGFIVLPYINDDPVLAQKLEEAGCAAVMPLAAPIGSGQGMVNLSQIRIIIERARVPVVVDAGLGAPSDAALAMETGAAACLVNTAIARAKDPAEMARAFSLGVAAGRLAWHAGRIPRRERAEASSPGLAPLAHAA